MDFLKKHYEKILLTVVLLGSVGLLVSMPFVIQAERGEVTQHVATAGRHATPLDVPDFSTRTQLGQRLANPTPLDLETTNRLFNPEEWQKTLDGRLVRRASLGEKQFVVTGIRALNLVLWLDKVDTNELGARYSIAVQHQAALRAYQQRLQHESVSVGDKTKTFQLIQVQGPPENPTALDLKLLDSGETVTLHGSTPYKRVDAYAADMRYDPEHLVLIGKRVGDTVNFAGDNYNIVAIEAGKVILSNQSNQKRTEFKYTPPQ